MISKKLERRARCWASFSNIDVQQNFKEAHLDEEARGTSSYSTARKSDDGLKQTN